MIVFGLPTAKESRRSKEGFLAPDRRSNGRGWCGGRVVRSTDVDKASSGTALELLKKGGNPGNETEFEANDASFLETQKGIHGGKQHCIKMYFTTGKVFEMLRYELHLMLASPVVVGHG